MAKIDLSTLSKKELQKLAKDIDKAIQSKEAEMKDEAVAEMRAVAEKHGFKLEELVAPKAAKPKSPAKYRHPENPSATWSGRGRQPKWIAEALAAGKDLEDFRIAA